MHDGIGARRHRRGLIDGGLYRCASEITHFDDWSGTLWFKVERLQGRRGLNRGRRDDRLLIDVHLAPLLVGAHEQRGGIAREVLPGTIQKFELCEADPKPGAWHRTVC